MRQVLSGVLMSICGVFVVTEAEAPKTDAEIAQVFGALPRAGNSDILSCAGANDVLWTTAMKANPRYADAHDAKRKAGWYGAVALWVFQVDSLTIVNAVRTASEDAHRDKVFNLARQCRKAPDSWRE